MRKYTNPGAKERFAAAVAERAKERRQYLAAHLYSVLPGPRDEPVARAELIRKTVAAAKANGLGEHSFFKGNERRTTTFLSAQWSDVRREMEREEGIIVERGTGIAGMRRANNRGIEKTVAWQRRGVEVLAGQHNEAVGIAKDHVKLPMVQLRLLLPR